MASLEEIRSGVLVQGLVPQGTVTILSVTQHGAVGAEIVYRDASGHLGSELLYADQVTKLTIVPPHVPWQFTADGALFRLTAEAYRIYLVRQMNAIYETLLSKEILLS